MGTSKRRGGYLATAEGVKKLKEAKRIKKYTYENIREEAKVTLDQVKRLFNPQWGNGKYKIGEEAVEAICNVLDLKPEEIVADWYATDNISTVIATQESNPKPLETGDGFVSPKSNSDTPESKVIQIIEQAARDGVEELDISGMELTQLPAEIGKLSKLKKLILGKWDEENSEWVGNSLSSLPPEIVQLTNLTTLHLEANQLSSLPPEIVQLTNLTTLHLSYNKLSSLPPEIGQLTNLTTLHLNLNKLSSLPPEIGQLTNLTTLHLRGNSLPIPPEILSKYNQPADIINYYRSLLQNNQTKPLHEAKMLLVGQGSVGKTSLKERLIRNNYNPRRNKTDGIDIEDWTIEVDGRQLQVNIWDFGGQEIMHSTHQFFLTKRSLYVLVLDATLGEEENRIEYWLKIIQSFGKDSPVIIVGNKADQHPLDIDQRGLQDKYPQIKTFVETSCEENTGIEELAEVIKKEINQLEHIDDQLPLTWFNIKQKLENLKKDLKKDYIPYSEYESLCATEGVEEEDYQSTLIQFLHDLGVVLNFKDDDRLQDTHVLNPEWVTNGVYKILNCYELIVEEKGILRTEMLARILKRPEYPKNKDRRFIINMMRKFELCFDVEPDKQFLIPDILPKEEPYTGEWNNTLAFEYHYLVLPGSIISRFIVRMNHWIYEKNYWRSGVILENEGNKALVKADREDKKIIIRVNGPGNTRRNLLTAIRSHFDYIHKTIPGITPEEKVPLLDLPGIPPVDYQWLLSLERKGHRDVIVPGLTEEISIGKLLDGIDELSKRRN